MQGEYPFEPEQHQYCEERNSLHVSFIMEHQDVSQEAGIDVLPMIVQTDYSAQSSVGLHSNKEVFSIIVRKSTMKYICLSLLAGVLVMVPNAVLAHSDIGYGANTVHESQGVEEIACDNEDDG